MTIKGSLQVSIAIFKAFLTRNFVSSKIGQEFAVFKREWGWNVTFCFRDPKRRETTSSDVLILKIGEGDFSVWRRQNTKQDAQLSQRDRAAGCVIVFAKSRTLERGDNDLRTL